MAFVSATVAGPAILLENWRQSSGMESTEHRQQKLKRHVDDIVAKGPSTARRQKGRAALSSSLGKTFCANIAQQIIIRTADTRHPESIDVSPTQKGTRAKEEGKQQKRRRQKRTTTHQKWRRRHRRATMLVFSSVTTRLSSSKPFGTSNN